MSESRTIGVIVPVFIGTYYRSVLAGVHEAARERQVGCIAVQGTPRTLLTSQLAWDEVDGWVVILDTDGLDDRRWAGVPFVTVDAHIPELGGYAVLPDNEGGIKAAVDHLVGHGHARIGFVGYLEQNDIQQRFAGYQAGLAEHGIAFDPNLVFKASNNVEVGGRAAAQLFLDAGAPCTALVVATDLNVVGLLESIQAAGIRVPEDLAVTGFDNIPSAQLLSPPLATVAQRFDALGSTAVQLLLALIAGQAVTKGITRTATTLLPRRSCGCSSAYAERLPLTYGEQAADDWQEALATNLVRLLCYPAQVEEPNALEQFAAGTTLARGLAGALAGSPLIAQELEQAWRVLGTHTSDLELLHALIQRLKQTGNQQLAQHNGDAVARRHVDAFLDQATVEMMRSQHVKELTANNYQNTVATVNHAVSTQLMSDDVNTIQALTWLAVTTTTWACLGLWEQADRQPGVLRIAGSYDTADQPRPQIGERYTAAQFPPSACMPASTRDGGPDIVLTLPIETANRQWGVLALALPISAHLSLTLEYVGMWATLLGSALDRGQLTASLTQQSETLRLGYERERILSQTVRELGCPVIPLMNDVLLVPLIGLIDSERSGHILSAVLHGIERNRASAVLIDITGVPLIDTQVANVLIQLARSAALLGSQVIMVGVRPEIASSMVGLGVDLGHLLTFPTLAAALNRLQQDRRDKRGTRNDI